MATREEVRNLLNDISNTTTMTLEPTPFNLKRCGLLIKRYNLPNVKLALAEIRALSDMPKFATLDNLYSYIDAVCKNVIIKSKESVIDLTNIGKKI